GLGLGPGDVLGIHLPNTPQYLIALLAASKLGAVISGVSPLLTPGEIVHQINDADIRVLLTLDQLFNAAVAPVDGQVPGLKAVLVTGPIDSLPRWKQTLAYALKKVPRVSLGAMPSVRVIAYAPALRRAAHAPVRTSVPADATIMIQYTGGTTGKPKGAELTLAQLHSQSIQVGQACAYEDGREVIASAFPYFHVAGLILALVAMRHAAQLLVIPDPRNVGLFCQAMRRHPPTLMANVPTLFQMLLEHPPFHALDFSRLRMAISGAAPFSVDMMHKLEEVLGKGKLCEGYGMTECCGVTVINPIGAARIGSIGLPLPGTRLKIVDAETGMRELPAGEPGEIIINGGQVMKGYLNNPEATARTIRQLDGEPWLYTGDIAVRDADGYVTICDRAKD
ncbi:MAG: long-chain fatty acid--CoA ligase, partial [Perlucidibaca sp.]